MQEFLSNNESKTKEFAKKLASRLVQGSFLADVYKRQNDERRDNAGAGHI